MEPYWQKDNITIYCGSCLDMNIELPKDAVIIADPPYGINLATDYKSKGRGGDDFPPIKGDDEPYDPTPWLTYKRVVLWGANHYSDKLPPTSRWFVWDKRHGVPSNDGADCELAYASGKGAVRIFRHRWNGFDRQSERTNRRKHPTQKPVALMEWCFDQMKVQPGDLVIDPYMGSGPTAIAAQRRGIRFIGIEWEQWYCEMTVRRLTADRNLNVDIFAGDC